MPTLTPFRLTTAAGLAALTAVIATPMWAQQRDRPSRECIQEIRALCGSDRSQIRACLQERFTELSEGCAAEVRQRVQQRRGERTEGNGGGRAYVAPARVDTTVIYGDHLRQQIDIYEPDDAVEARPLILFVHGGGWSFGDRSAVQAKPKHFNDAGFYFASAGYRVLPDSPVEEQAADLGMAIRALHGQASAIGFDGDSIVLVGHSAGAHLAALVATDPSYAGDSFASIRGVILLDGAGYDIAANIENAGPQGWQLYNRVFGTDPSRHAALSPVSHVGGEDAPHWLALYVDDRGIARDQSQALVSSLSDAGVDAIAVAISDTDHGRINRELGTEAGTQQTDAVDSFLERIFQ